jgi:hypothetical protein
LFKYEPRLGIKLDNNFYSEEEKLKTEEMEGLESRFTEEEIKKQCLSHSNGAPSPNVSLSSFIRNIGM